MHTNKNHSIFVPCRARDKDGHLVLKLPVDQFFSLNINKSEHGFMCSDVELLDKASKLADNGIRYQALLNHFKFRLKSEPDFNKGKTYRQIFDEIRPAFIQTPAELTRFFEWAQQHQVLEKEQIDNLRSKVEEPVSDITESES